MFPGTIFFLIILPLTENSLYLYNTENSPYVQFYDCITDTNLPYCRRPSQPITLQRDQSVWHCYHEGITHNFTSLIINNISISTILHQWKSTIEKVEEYSRYIKQRQLNETIDGNEIYLCECIHPQTFGKYCEYLLPMGTTFNETITWEVEMRKINTWDMQMYSDIVCYTTLICDYGLLCLDWRDICDGVQHCMFGYDEENCDKLEFNECEDNEYRCMNGMCIPDEYFLDGDYDCADLSDEKQISSGGTCAFQEASYQCDDRICFRHQWSCGDGECIWDRLYFQTFEYAFQCNNFRDRYYMCELHYQWSLWTLPNEKCYQRDLDYEEVIVHNRSDSEVCIYFMKCALSLGAEKNCQCRGNLSCMNRLKNPCNSSIIQYPNGAIMAPYVFSLYTAERDWSEVIPDEIKMIGTIKCRGYMISQKMFLKYFSTLHLRELETIFCTSKLNNTISTNIDYGEFCYNDSRTFNNRSYHFIDICKESKECISAYRIMDGYKSCIGYEDERRDAWFSNVCSNIQRHRFQCSNEEPTCLLVITLGDKVSQCQNSHDERWMGGETMLSKLVCNTESKDDCESIRQYVKASTKIDSNNSFDQQMKSSIIPFRTFCDTFWNWGSKKDEDIKMCQEWWTCLENQWQCRSGQCIEIIWVLDGEWDCVDGSDEQGLFISTNRSSTHNLNVTKIEELEEKFNILYSNQSFWKLCNLSMEYPCFLANVSDPLNITKNRPCINLHQIGDNRIDCVGGLDERNTLKHCSFSTMLGYNFQCLSGRDCISYSSHCPYQCVNNSVQCYGNKQTLNCSKEFDFTCLNGQCAKDGWCNQHFDCSHGEDELFCTNQKGATYISIDRFYRNEKEFFVRTTKQNLQLPQLPTNIDENNVTDKTISISQNKQKAISTPYKINSTISYYCNRGIGIQLYNGSIVCFCPPQYYGDKCQFHIDRITFLFHLNLSQSIYVQSNNTKLMLHVLIIFLNEDQLLRTESFHIQVIDAINVTTKKFLHLFYSRSNESLQSKRARYFNRSNIINEHPYSVRIEAYELNPDEKPRLVAVWLHPIYFDFLPSFRLAKVLRLTESDRIKNPCSSNPCNSSQECHQILNENLTYVFLCPANFKGDNCSIIDNMCQEGFCSTNALCKPNYRGLLNGNKQPYCICPFNQLGHRCDLIHDKCDENPCQNNGTCLSTSKPNGFICLCHDHYFGDDCQLKKQSLELFIKKRPEHRAAVVQYFDIDYFSLNLLLVHQRVYINLPDLLYYVYNQKIQPAIIIVKLYSNIEYDIYLISIQIDVESINRTTEMSETNRCVDVQTLFLIQEEISPFKYHSLCNQNQSLLCFFDDSYLCICDKNHIRSECFIYDKNLDQCSSCLNNGQCLKEDRSKSDLICLCHRCYYGKLCQFSIEGIGFTLDSLIIQVHKSIQIISFIFSFIIFLIGGITNYANIITFKRPNLRKTSIGIYLIIYSLISQYSLFSLIFKIFLILFDILMNDITCKILSYTLSMSIRYSYWLTSWIAIERLCYLLFPFFNLLKKLSIARRISFITLIIISLMHIHELIFYISIKDPNEQNACVINYPLKIRSYDRINVLIHYIIPFCIQLFSITILIFLAARSRSRTTITANKNNRETFNEYLKKQFQNQKELYMIPSVIIFSGLPQIILSFSFACIVLVKWQQYLLLIAYFLSYIPQLLGFILFVLPSTNYRKEFQKTNLSKTIIFRWIISKKKIHSKK